MVDRGQIELDVAGVGGERVAAGPTQRSDIPGRVGRAYPSVAANATAAVENARRTSMTMETGMFGVVSELDPARALRHNPGAMSVKPLEIGVIGYGYWGPNLARHLGVEPETALQGTNATFMQRFRAMEERAAESGRSFREMDLAEQDALWEEVKAHEGRARKEPEAWRNRDSEE